jgi:thiol:disulfide interchange protein
MTKLTFSLLLFISIFLSPFTLAEQPKAELYVVKFHADWCGSCKILGPQIKKARGKAGLDNSNVLFVKLDLTDATKRNQSALMASALGLAHFYEKNAGKTGFALLVDADNGEIKGRLTKDMNAEAIIQSIQSHI